MGCWRVHWGAAQELRESSRCSWVWAGRAAGGCLMGQAGSWAGALWACSWRLPDGPGWQLGVHYGHAAGGCPMGQAGSWGCTMGVQLAVARWARLSAGRVHYGRAAGGCPMGQAVSWAGAQWACSWRLTDGPGCQLGVLWLSRRAAEDAGHARYAGVIYFSYKIMIKASNVAQIIYMFRYRISTELYMRISKA